jgi:hypothetical protein
MTEPIIEIKIDEAKLRNIQQMLRDIPRALPRVISRSINRTVSPVRTAMARQLVEPMNAEVSSVRDIQMTRQRKVFALKYGVRDMKKNIRFQKAKYNQWYALIWIKRYTGQEAQETQEKAFIARMPKSGHIGIFRRLGATKLPIADQIRRLMRQFFEGISDQIRQQAQSRLNKNIEDQVMLALNQWRQGAKKAG